MLRKILIALAIVAGAAQPLFAADAASDPKADLKAFRDYFTSRFPKVKLDDFVNALQLAENAEKMRASGVAV